MLAFEWQATPRFNQSKASVLCIHALLPLVRIHVGTNTIGSVLYHLSIRMLTPLSLWETDSTMNVFFSGVLYSYRGHNKLLLTD